MNYTELGQVIRLLCIANNIKSKELAEKCGVSGSFVSDIIHGRKKLSYNSLDKVSKALDMPVSQIIAFVEQFSEVEYTYQDKLKTILKVCIQREEQKSKL